MSVYAGAEAPFAYELRLVSQLDDEGEPLVDLSTVTAAVFRVEGPQKVRAEWSASIVEQTATSLKLRHVFAAAETPRRGPFKVYAWLDVPGGHLRSETRTIPVLGEFETEPFTS